MWVVVSPLDEAAVVSAHLWFDAGAADETPSEHGAAHFVEHLLFKGTARRPVGGSAAAIEGLGGDLNAWTSYDETTLHATALGDGAAEVVDVLVDMAQHATFDPDEVERERQVVIEELRGYADDPESVAADHLQAQVFADHAYGRPIIGTEASVRALTRADLVEFWRRHYHPGRAVLTVAGPVDAATIRDQVRALTASWPAGAARASLPPPALPRRRAHLVDRDFGSVVVQMGYPGPAVDDPDVAALDVLLAGLGQGGASRLHTRLDLQAGVASSVWSQAQHYRRGGLIAVTFCCGETEEALALAHETLTAVGDRGLDVAEVQRARDGLLADLLFATETTDGIAGELAWSMARLGHPGGLDTYRDALRSVTPDDVSRVARRFLDPDRLQVVVIDREITESTLERQVPPEPPPPRSAPSRSRSSGPVTVEIDGATVACWPDSSEVVGIKVIGWGGQSLEEARFAGSTEAWARTVVRGAGPYDAVAYAERADALALSFDATAGRSTMGLDATFPAAHTEAALALFGRMLTEPRFDVEDFNHVREAMLDDLAAQVDQSDTVATEALWRTLWPRHPWRLPVLGTAATLSRVRPGRLAAIHDVVMHPENLVIGVAGGFDPDVVLAEIERWIDALGDRASRSLQLAVPRDRGASRRASPRTRYAGTQQATVLLGTRGVAYDDPDRLPLGVSTAVLDSQAGRLFLQLREVRGLAYSVWARSDVGLGGGTYSAGLATDPARVDEAASALRGAVLELATDGPTDEELARIRRMIVGQAAMRLQRVAGRASELAWSERLGREIGVDALRARLERVTPAAVREALGRLDLAEAITVRVLPRPNADEGSSEAPR